MKYSVHPSIHPPIHPSIKKNHTILQNKSKCACQQLTVESSAITNGGKPNPDAGYKHRRLPEPLISGYVLFDIYRICHELTVEIKFYYTSLEKFY